MTVEFGFVIPQGADWEALSHFAATAERVGIDHLWAVDHMMDIPADRPLHFSISERGTVPALG